MTCTRCGEEVSFNQWLTGPCRPIAKDSAELRTFHSLSEKSIRNAYSAMLQEAAYARTQP